MSDCEGVVPELRDLAEAIVAVAEGIPPDIDDDIPIEEGDIEDIQDIRPPPIPPLDEDDRAAIQQREVDKIDIEVDESSLEDLGASK
jgi:hypothetical protein